MTARTADPHRLACAALTVLALTVAAAGAFAQTAAPEPAQTPVGRALERVSAGDLAGAVAILEPVVAAGKGSALATALLGGLLVQVDRPAEALKVLAPLASSESADPAVLYNAGRAALAVGQTERGEGFLERSVALDASSIAGRELGLLRRQQGRIADAYSLLKPWIERNPGDQEAMVAAAHCAIQLRRVPEAEQILALVSSDSEDAILAQAALHLVTGDFKSAIAIAEPHLPTVSAQLRPAYLGLLGDAYLRDGNSQAVVSLLEGNTGDRAGLRLMLARATFQQGNLARATELFEPLRDDLLKSGPGSLPTDLATLGCIEYGRVLLAGSKAETALPYLQHATQLMPQRAEAWQVLGQALLMAGRREEGQAAMERFQQVSAAADKDPYRNVPPEAANADPTARNLAAADRMLARGEVDQGLAAIRQEQTLAPQDLRPWLHEVQVLLSLDRKPEAAAAVNAAVERFAGQPDPLYLRGVVAMVSQRLQAAEKDFRQTLALAPQHTAAMTDLAVLLMASQRRDEAEKLLRRVLELRPEDANARAHLEELQAGKGR
jgi:tetratricopeptide (TPR) repeat protein